MLMTCLVNGAVNLDYQCGIVTVEVDDQPVDGLLAPEVNSVNSVASDFPP